jgi:hypothetical protein
MTSLEQLSTDVETIKELILDYPTRKRASFNSPLSSAEPIFSLIPETQKILHLKTTFFRLKPNQQGVHLTQRNLC